MDSARTPNPEEVALQRIIDAGQRVPRGAQALVTAVNQALDELQIAVDDARALGLDWGLIDDALGAWGEAAATTRAADSDFEAVVNERVVHPRPQPLSEQLWARHGHTAFHPNRSSPTGR